jgi:poly-gamma-glutamate synthesis protein (capsule biosynthesis protein)
MLNLPWYEDITLKLLLFFAETFNIWKYPRKLDPDARSVMNDVYWVYKTKHPIIHAPKDSNIEEYFNQQLKEPKLHLPQNFEIQKRISISTVGDLMNAPGIVNSKNKFYENVNDLIFNKDVSIGNLESTLTSKGIDSTEYKHGQQPLINATMEEYNALKGYKNQKFDILMLANNHIIDRGMDGFSTTIQTLEDDGIEYFGINLNKEDENKAFIYEANGIRLGIIGFTYSVNNRDFPDGKDFLVNYVPFHQLGEKPDLDAIKTQIDYCREEKCDMVLLFLHWGIEYELYPRPYQIEIAHELAEYGADMIISHHAHIIQPYELFQSHRDNNRVVPIFYGLGNLSATKSNPHITLSLILNFEILKGQLEGSSTAYPKNLTVTPVFQMEKSLKGSEDDFALKLELLKDWINKPINDKELNQYIQKLEKYADLCLGQKWRQGPKD